jgi:hypothetical protein
MFWIIIGIFLQNILYACENNQSAFYEELTVQNTPVVQLQFPYSLLPNYTTTSLSGLSLSGSGTVTQGTGAALIRTGITANSASVLASNARLTYRSGQGLVSFFSATFTTGVTNNIQIIGVGNSLDGFFFGYNGTSFGILYMNNSVDTWIPQASWNGDVMNGSGESGITLDPTDGNVYKIQYHWLGFCVVKFYIANPEDGEFILVHSLRLLNNNLVPIITNPSLQLLAATYNISGGTSNVTLQTSSMMGAIEGKSSILSNTRYAYTENFATTSANILNLFTLRNRFTYSSTATNNQVMIYPDTFSFYNAGTTAMNVFLYINTTNTYTYTNINANNSVAEVSNTAGENATVAGGVLIYFATIPPAKSEFIVNLSKLGIRLAPGQSITVAARRTSGTNVTLHASLSWTEGL